MNTINKFLFIVFLLTSFLILNSAEVLNPNEQTIAAIQNARDGYRNRRSTYNRHYFYKPYAQYNRGYQYYQTYPRYQYYFNDPNWFYYERAPGVYYYFRT